MAKFLFPCSKSCELASFLELIILGYRAGSLSFALLLKKFLTPFLPRPFLNHFARPHTFEDSVVREASKASVNLAFSEGVKGLRERKSKIFGVRAFFCYFFWHQKK